MAALAAVAAPAGVPTLDTVPDTHQSKLHLDANRDLDWNLDVKHNLDLGLEQRDTLHADSQYNPTNNPTNNSANNPTHNLANNPANDIANNHSSDVEQSTTNQLTNPNLFFRLPPELREQVYTHLLTHALFSHTTRRPVGSAHSFGSTSSTFTSSDYSTDNDNKPVHPAILLTCKLINMEATPILYGSNTFTAHYRLLDSMPHLHCSTRPILRNRPVGMIRHWRIHVRLDVDTIYPATSVRDAFSGAESLEIEASQAMFRAADYGNLLKFRGVRGVKCARVWGSVEAEFAERLENCMRRPINNEKDEEDDDGLHTTGDWNPWNLVGYNKPADYSGTTHSAVTYIGGATCV